MGNPQIENNQGIHVSEDLGSLALPDVGDSNSASQRVPFLERLSAKLIEQRSSH